MDNIPIDPVNNNYKQLDNNHTNHLELMNFQNPLDPENPQSKIKPVVMNSEVPMLLLNLAPSGIPALEEVPKDQDYVKIQHNKDVVSANNQVLGNLDEMGFDIAEKAEIIEVILQNHANAKELRDYMMISLTVAMIASVVIGALGTKVSNSISSIVGRSLIAVGFLSVAIMVAAVGTFFK